MTPAQRGASLCPPLVPAAGPEPPELGDLRRAVREFVDDQIASGVFVPGIDSWSTAWNPAFSRALGERGWVGMTIPPRYGGAGRGFVERFVVTEELLAAGAPVAAHWVADRQAAPALLRFGTEEQKQRYLPGIARGEIYWAIGMSEPEAGSDLAGVRTRAVRADGGRRVTGTKLWTTGAHRADALFALVRTEDAVPDRRHDGLSQLIVALDSPGVRVRPILSMAGRHHFNEVHFDDVFVPDDMVLGAVGSGWSQVTAELGYERSGPERFLSTFGTLAGIAAAINDETDSVEPRVGAAVARVFGLHHLSRAVSVALERNDDAGVGAAVVKVLGTRTEGDIADLADELVGAGTAMGPRLVDLVRSGLLQRPGFTLRGGTSEVLRGVIARGLGLR